MPAYTIARRYATYSRRELADALGVTLSRIESWRELNLLPPPHGPKRGRGSHFSDLHLRRGRELLRFLDNRYSLRDLSEMPPDELARVLRDA